MAELAGKITHKCFQNGLMIETSGADDQVIKFLCPLIISDEDLKAGIAILENAIRDVCAKEGDMPEAKSRETGQKHQLKPGVVYVLDKHAAHTLRAFTELKLACLCIPITE